MQHGTERSLLDEDQLLGLLDQHHDEEDDEQLLHFLDEFDGGLLHARALCDTSATAASPADPLAARLGLSSGDKAGTQAVDKEKANKIIYEMSKVVRLRYSREAPMPATQVFLCWAVGFQVLQERAGQVGAGGEGGAEDARQAAPPAATGRLAPPQVHRCQAHHHGARAGSEPHLLPHRHVCGIIACMEQCLMMTPLQGRVLCQRRDKG